MDAKKINADDSIWGAAARPSGRRVARKDDVAPVNATDKADAPREETASVRVVLSEDAQVRAGKAWKSITEQSNIPAQSSQDAARAKLAEIKQRIKMLKMMLTMVGPSAAKAIIAELRQLAGQLAQAAATLRSGSGGGTGAGGTAMAAPVVHGAGGSPDGAALASGAGMATGAGTAAAGGGTAAGAADMSGGVFASADAAGAAPGTDDSAENTAATAPPSLTATPATTASDSDSMDASEDASGRIEGSPSAAQERQRDARQRQADARAISELIRELKALLEAAERVLREDESADADDQHVGDIDALLSQAEQSARSLSV